MCAAVRISEQSGIYSALRSLHFCCISCRATKITLQKYIAEIVFAVIAKHSLFFSVWHSSLLFISCLLYDFFLLNIKKYVLTHTVSERARVV